VIAGIGGGTDQETRTQSGRKSVIRQPSPSSGVELGWTLMAGEGKLCIPQLAVRQGIGVRRGDEACRHGVSLISSRTRVDLDEAWVRRAT